MNRSFSLIIKSFQARKIQEFNNLRKILFVSFCLILVIGFTKCTSPSGKESNHEKGQNVSINLSDTALTRIASNITDTLIKTHIKYLAADSLMGRKPFTQGETRTLRYLVGVCKTLGLEPGNKGSYLQAVPMVQISSLPLGNMQINGKNKILNLSYKTDFIASTRREQETIHLKNTPMVFAGFGVVAPEYQWDDYAGLDVKGKTVLVLVNDPGFDGGDSHFFKGDTMTYYGRWTYKYEEAARHGASGILIIHQTKPASYDWSVVSNSFTGDKLYLQAPDKHLSRCEVEGWISEEATNKLFKRSGLGLTVEEAKKKARTRGFKAIPLGLDLSLELKNKLVYSTSQNVIAVKKGADSLENIVYTAHWDHLGIGSMVNGDSIYNGAIDNASGDACILSIAKAFTQIKEKLPRTLVFLFVTGEEQGLLGSEYFATHPIFPINKTVADINLDALGSYGTTKDISLVGLGQSELDDYVMKEAKKEGRYVVGDPKPGAGGYFRSDHFNFAKVGIPSLDLGEGIDGITQGKEWGKKQVEDYNDHHYHQPSDEYYPNMDASGMTQNARLFFKVGYQLSIESKMPKWKAGSEFKSIREKTML